MESISQAGFREALARFASGVTVVAVRTRSERPVGLTATAFSAVSLTPPLVLVCVARRSHAHDGVIGAERFGVSVLAEAQRWIAKQCARAGEERFDGVPWSKGLGDGVLLVDGAVVQLECRRHQLCVAGDHTILIGEVLETTVGTAAPLVHFARRFGTFSESPDGARASGEAGRHLVCEIESASEKEQRHG